MDNSEARLAWYLSERLKDRKSLAFYRKVVDHVSPAIVHQALQTALEVHPEDRTLNRAAYFTALIRPHLPARRKS